MYDQFFTPITLEVFQNKYRNRGHCHFKRNNPHFFDSLLTMEAFERELRNQRIDGNCLSLIPNLKDESIEEPKVKFEKKWGQVHTNLVDYSKLKTVFRNGFTIKIDIIDAFFETIGNLQDELKTAFPGDFNTNLYLTPAHSKGFNRHFDEYGVFILQIQGSKDWKIYNTPFKHPQRPHFNECIEHLDLQLLDAFKLEAGDMLYIPPGAVHEAKATVDHSLHLTLSFKGIMTWADLFKKHIDELSYENPKLREPWDPIDPGAERGFRRCMELIHEYLHSRIPEQLSRVKQTCGSINHGGTPMRSVLPEEILANQQVNGEDRAIDSAFEGEDYQQAILLLEDLLDRGNPSTAIFRLNDLGHAFNLSGRFTEGLSAFTKLIESDDCIEYFYNYAMTCIQVKGFSEAKDAVEKLKHLISKDPRPFIRHYALAGLSKMSGFSDESNEHLYAALCHSSDVAAFLARDFVWQKTMIGNEVLQTASK